MKAKVIIENGKTSIILTPDNEFDKDVIEKVEDKNNRFDINTRFNVVTRYGSKESHSITMDIIENTNP